MDIRRHSARLVMLAIVVSLPLIGVSGVASAKAKAGTGCHKTHSCKSGAGGGTGTGTGTGSGAGSPQITVEVDPNPLVETGVSEVRAVVQVETSVAFADDLVDISSQQLENSCVSLDFDTVNEATAQFDVTSVNNIQVALDNDGNATVGLVGTDCAPGSSLVEADLIAAPYYTATTTLVAEPPNVTPEGLTGYPQIAGVPAEVETGDTPASGNSDVYAVFYVETNPVYAEEPVEIGSVQLESSCGQGWVWIPGNGGTSTFGKGFDINGFVASTTLDNDGNAVFIFKGQSCAPSTSDVIADVIAGTHPTYSTTFTVVAPQPTI
jgi:hypothetical protein